MALIKLKVSNGHELFIKYREGTSDIHVVDQVWKQLDYDIGKTQWAGCVFREYGAIISKGKIPLIIDAGANIGVSALYFSECFGGAKTIAIEPERNNFELLLENSKQSPSIECLKAAVSSSDGEIDIVDPGLGSWGFRAEKADSCNKERQEGVERVPAISIPNIIAKQGEQYAPFIMKIDIEGGEEDLFSTNTDWVDSFPLIIIELHDRFFPGKAKSRNFFRCVSGLNRDFFTIGENSFSVKNYKYVIK